MTIARHTGCMGRETVLVAGARRRTRRVGGLGLRQGGLPHQGARRRGEHIWEGRLASISKTSERRRASDIVAFVKSNSDKFTSTYKQSQMCTFTHVYRSTRSKSMHRHLEICVYMQHMPVNNLRVSLHTHQCRSCNKRAFMPPELALCSEVCSLFLELESAPVDDRRMHCYRSSWSLQTH